MEPYLAQCTGDGKKRISQVTSAVDRVVIVGGGGWGTVNEIINGLPHGLSTPILQVPTGNQLKPGWVPLVVS